MNKIAKILRDKKDIEAFDKFAAELDKPVFPENDGKLHLRLVKTHDREIICDQDGREVQGIQGFRYEQMDVDAVPQLTLVLFVNRSQWTPELGVLARGLLGDKGSLPVSD